MVRKLSSKRSRSKRRNPYQPRDYDTLGQVVTPSFMDRNREIPASWGSQMFSIVPSLAGGLALFLLSFKLAKATRVSVTEVSIASLISVLGAMSAIFIIKTYH